MRHLYQAKKCAFSDYFVFPNFIFIFDCPIFDCLVWTFSSCSKQGLLIVAASLVEEHGLQGEESVVVAYGLSCSKACGIFLDQGSNLHPLHWQVDS